MRSPLRVAAVLTVLCITSATAAAFSLDGIDANAGMLYRSTYQGTGTIVAAPSPILNTAGVAFPFRFAGVLLFTPELRIYGTQYGLVPDTTRAVPVEVEYADSVWMLSAAVEAAFGLDLRIAGPVSMGMYVAPVFLAHIPLTTWGAGAEQRDQIAGYFYDQARYFLAAGGMTLTVSVYDNLSLLLRAETQVPVFHFWDGEGLPFHDQMTITATIGLRFKPGAAAASE